MKYALINKATNKVENVIILTEESNWQIPNGYMLIQSDVAQINSTWDGELFIVENEVTP